MSIGDQEMAKKLRVPIAPTKNLILGQWTYVVAHNYENLIPGHLTPFSGLHVIDTYDIHKLMQAHMHTFT